MRSYELSPEAAQDWRDIIRYTLDQHGEAQVRKYTDLLTECLENKIRLYSRIKSISINELNVYVIRFQKHYVFFLEIDDKPNLIIAFLHERMDFITRLKSRLE